MKTFLFISLLILSTNAICQEDLSPKELITKAETTIEEVKDNSLKLVIPKMHEVSALFGIGITGATYNIYKRKTENIVRPSVSIQYIHKYFYKVYDTDIDLGVQYSTAKALSIVPSFRSNDFSMSLTFGYGITHYQPVYNSQGMTDEGAQKGLVMGLQVKKDLGDGLSILGELKTNTTLQGGLGFSF